MVCDGDCEYRIKNNEYRQIGAYRICRGFGLGWINYLHLYWMVVVVGCDTVELKYLVKFKIGDYYDEVLCGIALIDLYHAWCRNMTKGITLKNIENMYRRLNLMPL